MPRKLVEIADDVFIQPHKVIYLQDSARLLF